MFASAAILLSYFGEERSWGGGGGTPDPIHKITKLNGLLRVFTPYFYWCVCHIKVQSRGTKTYIIHTLFI